MEKKAAKTATKKSMRDVIYENDKAIKKANKALANFDKLLDGISLNKGASTAVINNLSPSDPDLQEAQKQLGELGLDPDKEEKVQIKPKKRKRLNKIMRGKLQI
ncbi:MAG: hypothetical protein OXD32_06400 [Endozoicomonadaceae bacterium]|nr:hypothetical protein [Endozoicomonadaceae bacterium]MCY4328682.1 hypothetical protein [Endozoicomonadaceae bacterium]